MPFARCSDGGDEVWWLPCPGYAADAVMVEMKCGGYRALAKPLMTMSWLPCPGYAA